MGALYACLKQDDNIVFRGKLWCTETKVGHNLHIMPKDTILFVIKAKICNKHSLQHIARSQVLVRINATHSCHEIWPLLPPIPLRKEAKMGFHRLMCILQHFLQKLAPLSVLNCNIVNF